MNINYGLKLFEKHISQASRQRQDCIADIQNKHYETARLPATLIHQCQPASQLRTSLHYLLDQSTTQTVFVSRVFYRDAPIVWNILPFNRINNPLPIASFKKQQKTHLFLKL